MRITCLDLSQALTLCFLQHALPLHLCPSALFSVPPAALTVPHPQPQQPPELSLSPLQPPTACCLSLSLCDQTLSFCACVSRTQHQIHVTSLYLHMAAPPSEVLGSQSRPSLPRQTLKFL